MMVDETVQVSYRLWRETFLANFYEKLTLPSVRLQAHEPYNHAMTKILSANQNVVELWTERHGDLSGKIVDLRQSFLLDCKWVDSDGGLLNDVCGVAEGVARLGAFDRVLISVEDATSLCAELYWPLRDKLNSSRRYGAERRNRAYQANFAKKRRSSTPDAEPTFVGRFPIAVTEMIDKFTARTGEFAKIRHQKKKLKKVVLAVTVLRNTLNHPSFPENNRQAIGNAFTSAWREVDALASLAATGVAHGLCLVPKSNCVELCDLLISYCVSAQDRLAAIPPRKKPNSSPKHETATGNAGVGGGAPLPPESVQVQSTQAASADPDLPGPVLLSETQVVAAPLLRPGPQVTVYRDQWDVAFDNFDFADGFGLGPGAASDNPSPG
jgi:hypothetical protein